MAPKPKRTKLIVSRVTFLLGNVISRRDIITIDTKEMTIKVSLNLCVLSNIMPVKIDPIIPEMMNAPPKRELLSTV